MRFLVLGAGGIGGYFGGRLAAAGAEVTFLVRPRRAAQIEADGLVVESPFGNLRLRVAVVTAETVGGPRAGAFDAILLTAKAYDLDSAIAAIGPAVGEETAILPLLNGMSHLERLDAAFGGTRVLGGAAYIAATLDSDGVVRHLNRAHALSFGERSGEKSRRVTAIAEAFAATPVTAKASPDILYDMWEKFVMLTTLAGMTCLLRGSVGEIVAAPEGEALMLELLAECEAVAAASGYPSRARFREECRSMLTKRGSNFSASMRRDLEKGARTEADAVLGDMRRRALGFGIEAPLLRVAACHLAVHERRLASAL